MWYNIHSAVLHPTAFLDGAMYIKTDKFIILSTMTKQLTDQPQPLQLPGVLRARGDQINPGGFNGAVAQHIGQFRNVPCGPVEGRGKQVPQVVGEYFGGLYPSLMAKSFHLPPDLTARQTVTASSEKNFSGGDFLLSGVFEQFPAELGGQ